MKEQEEKWIEAIRNGKTEAFANIMQSYEGLVCHIVYRLIRREADREDVCQDIFIRVFKGLSAFRFESKLSTWIGRIAYRTCLNRLEKKQPLLYEDLPAADSATERADGEDLMHRIERRDLLRHLEAQVDRLPPIYQTLLTLYHVDGFKISEISHIVSLPEGTVKNYLHRARTLVRERLSKQFAQEVA